MSGNDLQVVDNMLADALITEFEYQRSVDIEEAGERVAATIELLHTKQNMISAKLDHLKELGGLTEAIGTDSPNIIEDVIEENEVMPTPVLLLTTVLSCLFGYFNVGDLKSCKGVCRKWREVAEVNIRKRAAATIVFSDQTSLSTFMAYYPYSLLCKPFTSFSFSSEDNNYCNDDLENFFSKFGKSIKQLAFVSPGFRYPPFKFDFGPFLRPSIITKLHLQAAMGNDQELHQSLARFNSLKYLHATNYILHTEGLEKKLSLLELNLAGVNFHNGNQIVSQLLINEVFDLRNAETIILKQDINKTTQLSIDMTSEVSNAGNVEFSEVTCINWTGCNWKIDRFQLCGVQFTQPHQAKITKLYFWACEVAQIDLALLSDCIEEVVMVLEYSDNSAVLCSRPIILPNLNKLRLHIGECDTPSTADTFQNVLQHFMLCENLLEVELVGEFHQTCNLTVVPPSVRKMKISNFPIRLNANLNLQKLVIDTNEIEDVEINILPWVNAEELILTLREVSSFQEFDRVFELMLAKYDKIFLSIFQNVNFLSKYGHLEGNNYYAFVNQTGVEITKEEFDIAGLLRPNL